MLKQLLCMIGRHDWITNPFGELDYRRVQFCSRCPEARFKLAENGPWIKLTSIRASLWILIGLEKMTHRLSSTLPGRVNYRPSERGSLK